MQKTIGGDRIGSGKKMKVDLKGYERSTQDIGYVWRSTMSTGTLVPFMKELALPGDTFDIDLNCEILTHPSVGPLFGSYKVQLDVFAAPIRLYQGQLHNNKLGIGLKMDTVKLPMLLMEAPNMDLLNPIGTLDMDNWQIHPSCIFSYLGIRGVGSYNSGQGGPNSAPRNVNAIPYLAYWDIYKNYYANKQEEIGAVIHYGYQAVPHEVLEIYANGVLIEAYPATGTTALNTNDMVDIWNQGNMQVNIKDVTVLIGGIGWITLDKILINYISGNPQTYNYNGLYGNVEVWSWQYADIQAGQEINIVTFPLDNIDTMRENILVATQQVGPFIVNKNSLAPYGLSLQTGNATKPLLNAKAQNQEGLALKTYQSDLFNNWLSTEWIDGVNGISEITAVDTSAGSFTMDTLALAKKVYDMLNRIAISGGSYDDWMDAVYTHDRYTRAESPVYHGGLIRELVFQEVISLAGSADGTGGTDPLGTLGGRGTMTGKRKGGQVTIRVDEPSYIIGIISITPRLDYSQGNDWDIHLETMDDLHKPALDEIGFQELITEQMAWWDTNYNAATGLWITKSAGKQPAWINYMTNVNKVRGNFAIESNEMFMTLNRKYEIDRTNILNITIQDLTTYVDPRIFNNIFAETSIDSQNFWAQIGVDITARRKLSAKIMPNL